MGIPILITGGLGYVGGVVARTLLDMGHEVRIVDHGRHSVSLGLLPDRSVVLAPIESGSVASLLEDWKPRAVLHFAASAFVGYGEAHPLEYVQNNVGAFSKFLSSLAVLPPGTTLIHSGSCAVYGNGRGGFAEHSPTAPVSWYGQTKLIAENLALECSRLFGFRVIGFRYFNAVGSAFGIVERRSYEERIVPRLFKALDASEPFVVNGRDHPTPDGTCVRDYVHVADLAEAHVRAALEDTVSAGVYNLGSGEGHSVLDVVRAVEKAAGRKIEVQYGPRRPGDPPSAVAELGKAERCLGWRSRRSLAEAISDAWSAWHTTG